MDRLERQVLERVRAMRAEPTSAEKTLWWQLRAKKLMGTRWRRQAPWHGYIIDFYCAGLGIAVEVDGPVHEQGDQARRDHFKHSSLERAGIQVIRVRNEDVINELPGVLRLIRAAVEAKNRRTEMGGTHWPAR